MSPVKYTSLRGGGCPEATGANGTRAPGKFVCPLKMRLRLTRVESEMAGCGGLSQPNDRHATSD